MVEIISRADEENMRTSDYQVNIGETIRKAEEKGFTKVLNPIRWDCNEYLSYNTKVEGAEVVKQYQDSNIYYIRMYLNPCGGFAVIKIDENNATVLGGQEASGWRHDYLLNSTIRETEEMLRKQGYTVA